MNIVDVTDNEVGVVFTTQEWKTYLYLMKFVGVTTPSDRMRLMTNILHDAADLQRLENIHTVYPHSGWMSMRQALVDAMLYPFNLKDCLK